MCNFTDRFQSSLCKKSQALSLTHCRHQPGVDTEYDNLSCSSIVSRAHYKLLTQTSETQWWVTACWCDHLITVQRWGCNMGKWGCLYKDCWRSCGRWSLNSRAVCTLTLAPITVRQNLLLWDEVAVDDLLLIGCYSNQQSLRRFCCVTRSSLSSWRSIFCWSEWWLCWESECCCDTQTTTLT